MDRASRTGLPVVGILFLTLGVFNLLRGEGWVVWIILGVLFGGLGIFARRPKAAKDGRPLS